MLKRRQLLAIVDENFNRLISKLKSSTWNMSKFDCNENTDKASNADQCEIVKAELSALLAKFTAKQEGFKAKEKKTALNCKGRKATDYLCGNSVDPNGGSWNQ